MRTKFLCQVCVAAGVGMFALLIGCKHDRIAQGTSEQRGIAEACLGMLRSPLTNESDIAVSDPRIPKMIRALHPVAIQLAGTDAVVMCSGSPAEYHLSRRPSAPRIWILYAAGGAWGAEHRELLRISE
jgi:hypothetical protein